MHKCGDCQVHTDTLSAVRGRAKQGGLNNYSMVILWLPLVHCATGVHLYVACQV